MAMTLNEIRDEAYNNSADHGFWDDVYNNPEEGVSYIPEKLALIHSEVSEALEDYRTGNDPTLVVVENGKPEGFGSELADIVIRVADLAGALGIDLETIVEDKMRFNRGRPHRHGKVC